jgi:threonylcarbamoyladenosine tRNA methylthiotransferase MtaB
LKKVSFYTLGCKVNTYDTTYMQELFLNDGFDVVDFGQPCDIVVVNTCTVTGTADKKSRAIVRRAAKNGKVIVAGCMAQKRAEQVLAMDGVNAVIGTDDRSKIVTVAKSILSGESNINATHDIGSCGFEQMQVKTSGNRTRSTIKIQEGCNCFCSYCIIPYVRGRSRSKKLNVIITEATAIANGGAKEIVLTGIHIASYEDGDYGLADVVSSLDKLNVRIRLGSIDLGVLGSEFVRKISTAKNLCPHFHLSLQSGSQSVLQRMNRNYTPEAFMAFVTLLRENFDKPAITTDIITGFPGETEEEFADTMSFAANAAFARIHVFPFSAREGTKAFDMIPKIPTNIARKRANELIALGETLESNYLMSMQGKTDNVLFEEESKVFKGLAEGYSSRYIRVAANAQINECKQVVLGDISNKTMQGELI